MGPVETVEIHSLKDDSQMWRINKDEYDAEKHKLWCSMPEEEDADTSHDELPDDPSDEVPDAMSDDYVVADDGAVVGVYVADPHDRRHKLEVKPEDYDPNIHTLWSERGK